MKTVPKFPDILVINIDQSPWGYPIIRTQAAFSMIELDGRKSLKIIYTSNEWPVRCFFTEFNSTVCKDSCVEIFLNAYPDESDKYLSVEVNANGVVFSSFGENRYNRILTTPQEIENITILTDLNEKKSAPWTVEIVIPLDFLASKYNLPLIETKKVIKANLYKCGEDTQIEHYNSWQPIKTENPDFHQSSFFGDLLLKI